MYTNLHKTIISNTFHTDAPYKTRAGAGEKAANGLAPVALHFTQATENPFVKWCDSMCC